MNIQLENIGKRFNREWIFKNVNLKFEDNVCIAITGGNGSGKSTLLQIISGYFTPSAGRITWNAGGQKISSDDIFKHISWATPYVSVYDEFTLKENVEFFLKFKKLRGGVGAEEFAQKVSLENQMNKPLKQFSSGMRQRVKLGLAIMADTPLLLLDEPTSHLDSHNTQWYQKLLSEYKNHRSIFISSNNNADEIFLCEGKVVVEDLKG